MIWSGPAGWFCWPMPRLWASSARDGRDTLNRLQRNKHADSINNATCTYRTSESTRAAERVLHWSMWNQRQDLRPVSGIQSWRPCPWWIETDKASASHVGVTNLLATGLSFSSCLCATANTRSPLPYSTLSCSNTWTINSRHATGTAESSSPLFGVRTFLAGQSILYTKFWSI
jgi:hypothetical protein